MASAAWSVKGIQPDVRHLAKSAAHDAGMSLGEWLEYIILHDPELPGSAELRDALSPDSQAETKPPAQSMPLGATKQSSRSQQKKPSSRRGSSMSAALRARARSNMRDDSESFFEKKSALERREHAIAESQYQLSSSGALYRLLVTGFVVFLVWVLFLAWHYGGPAS